MTPVVRKYAAFVRVAAAGARRAHGELYGRVAFFAVILGVFSSLWRAVAEAGMPVAADPKALVWYLAVTEWIVLSAPPIHLEIEEAIRRGDVACQLTRPVSYAAAVFAEGVGVIVTRGPVLGATACLCAFLFTDWVPPLVVVACVIPLGLAAAALLTGIFVGIGLLAFWLDDVSPVYWIAQKLLFILGGLMLPLELYPEVMQRVASLTPFPAALAGPASLILHGTGAGSAEVAGRLLLWGAIVGLAVWGLFSRATSRMTVNGG